MESAGVMLLHNEDSSISFGIITFGLRTHFEVAFRFIFLKVG
jgi:hypothetical protein